MLLEQNRVRLPFVFSLISVWGLYECIYGLKIVRGISEIGVGH